MERLVSIREVLRGNILVLTVSRVLWSVSTFVVAPYLSLYILALGGTDLIIGLVNAFGSLSASLLYPIGGYIADKAGRAKFLAVSTILYTSSFIVLALAPSWEWVAIGFVYQQIALFYMPAMNAITADSIPVGERGKAYGITIAMPGAVGIVAPYIGGYLISIYTLRSAMRLGYTLAFGIGILVTFIRARYLKETIASREKIGRDISRIFKQSYSDVLASIRWLLSNIRGYVIVVTLLAFMGSLVMPFWVVYANKVIGISAYDWGLMLLLCGAVRTLISFNIGTLVDKLGSKKCMTMALAMAVPCVFLFTRASSFIQVAIIYLMLVAADALIWISTSVFLADSVARPMRGRVMAGLGQGVGIGVGGGGHASGFIVFVPMSIGAFTGGLIYTINPAYPWIIQSLLLTAALVLSLVLIREPKKAEE